MTEALAADDSSLGKAEPDTEPVGLTVTDSIAVIRLQANGINVLNRRVHELLRKFALEIAGRSDVRAVVLWGGPRSFAAGADLRELADLSSAQMLQWNNAFSDSLTTITRIPQPTIAAITGYALGGGCELALCTDFRVVAENAKIGLPEIQLGIIPGAGGTQRLTRLIGPARAKRLIFSGKPVNGAQAVALGLADEVVAPENVLDTALAWAADLANGPAQAMAAAKMAVDAVGEPGLQAGLRMESALVSALFDSPDKVIGMASFAEHGPGKAVFTR